MYIYTLLELVIVVKLLFYQSRLKFHIKILTVRRLNVKGGIRTQLTSSFSRLQHCVYQFAKSCLPSALAGVHDF